MSRTLIIGGHGRIALLLAPLLVENGHEVVSVVRNPDHVADVEQTGAQAHVADVAELDTAALTELFTGADAIVWAAGAGGGSAERTYAIDRDAAIRSMEAADAAGARRYVMVSWIGSRADHGVSEEDSFFAYADAKWAADEYLRGTDLGATILGPGALKDTEGTGRIQIDEEGTGAVSRADVAAVAAVALQQPATIGRTIRFGNGTADTAISIVEALAR
jgi:uncharacterized protein YbjT (DUF2867 family)